MLKNAIITFCLLATAFFAQAQSIVTGTVKDAESGELLMGVSVRVDGTTVGTSTDLDGAYSIKASENATLSFSYMGYEAVSEKVNGRTQIDVTLHSKDELMDEVVVVGYTSMKRRDINGAVSKIDSKVISELPVASTAQAMQGRIAGVQVSNATGAPGAGISVRVRGVGSISSDNEPLYIVDGIPVEDALNTLSPNDIENISVLKDASSAAIYGSRANNGVVLITTKSGKKGKAQVTYHGQFGFQTHGNLIEMANTKEYIDIYNQATAVDNIGTAITRPLIEGDYLNGLADVDHVGSIFRTAPIFNQELSVSGGTDKVNYMISGSYFNQEGIIRNSGYERATLRASINSDVKKWLSVGFSMNGSIANTQTVASSGDGYGNSEGGSVVRYAMFRNPAIPIKDADGNYIDKPSNYFGNSVYDTFFGDGYNPVGYAENTDRKRTTDGLLTNLNVTFKLPFDLKWTNKFGLDYNSSRYKELNKTWGDDGRINGRNGVNVNTYRNLSWTFNTVLDWQHTFNEDHTIQALIGFEANRNTYKTLNASDQSYSIWNKDVLYIGNGTAQNKIASETEEAYALASFFAQAQYNYKSRYYVSGTVRRDGSSKFIGKNRWGTFYSVSAGWNLDQEAFMQDVDWMNKLKLRVGYGAIGNQNIGMYGYANIYNSGYNYPFGGVSFYGMALSKLGNPDLKWETSNQFNVGVDMEFLKGSIAFSADFYNKINNGMLVEASLPISSGTADPFFINSGKVLNRGVDLELMYRHYRKDYGFDITFNGGYLYNEVLELDAPIYSGRVDHGVYATKTEVGYPIGSFFMYEMDGIFQNETEILISPYQGSGVRPGDVKYKNNCEDNVIDDKDRKHVGSSIPKFTTGITINAYYKGFDLGLFFQGAFGHKIYNQILTDSEGFYRGFNVTKRYYDNHWTGEGSTNEYPRASWKAKANNTRVSTRFLEDGSYMRLKNVQLGYTFNTTTWGIDKFRIYASVTNPFTITKYSGFDPEMTVSANSSSEGDRANGIDWGTYPVAITYTFGINLTF